MDIKLLLFAGFFVNTGVHTDEDYYGGSVLLAWDRAHDNCIRYHRHKMSGGTIDINFRTGTVLAETVTVIVYATYSSDIIIEDRCVYHTTF